LLTGMLGLQPIPTVGETIAWLLYAIPMGLYVLWPARRPPLTERSPEPIVATS
jgi:high-affinity iron transporter